MALDKNTLRNDLLTAMNTAKKESWTAEQVAAAFADAIDRYTRAAAVKGVTVTVANVPYTQTVDGRLA
jgi:hypothetical protein